MVIKLLSLYPAIFYKEKDGSFSVVFPDLNHLATDGENFSEAMEMAIDCLAGYIFSAQQDGEEIPPPTPIEQVDPHCEDAEGDDYETVFANVVAVDVEEYAAKHFEKAVKKTLTLPESLNKAAESLQINFSALLKEKLLEVCAAKPPSAAAAVTLAVTPFTVVTGLIAGGIFKPAEKNVKKTLTIPKWLNERAMAMNVNFSEELRKAVTAAVNSNGKI